VTPNADTTKPQVIGRAMEQRLLDVARRHQGRLIWQTRPRPSAMRLTIRVPMGWTPHTRPNFGGTKFGGLSSSGVDPHEITTGETLGANASPRSFGPKLDPTGEDIAGTSALLNAAARPANRPGGSGFKPGAQPTTGSPIVGLDAMAKSKAPALSRPARAKQVGQRQPGQELLHRP